MKRMKRGWHLVQSEHIWYNTQTISGWTGIHFIDACDGFGTTGCEYFVTDCKPSIDRKKGYLILWQKSTHLYCAIPIADVVKVEPSKTEHQLGEAYDYQTLPWIFRGCYSFLIYIYANHPRRGRLGYTFHIIIEHEEHYIYLCKKLKCKESFQNLIKVGESHVSDQRTE